ncbi:MAG: thiamine pyrophosphate-binding protein [Hyphomicrobiales bacterium]
MRSGGQILIDTLIRNGVDTIFGVPGESYLNALNAIAERGNAIRYITCRQEGGAAFMAEAFGNLLNVPGVCFVTRGPGVTNASIGVHTAFQGSTPMLLLIGQVPRGQMEREAFQEIDYRNMLGPMTKWVAQIDAAARIPEMVTRALRTAVSGRPGPVALALPEDMLAEETDVEDIPPFSRSKPTPSRDEMIDLRTCLRNTERPLLVLGGTGWTEKGRADITAFAEQNALPVVTAFRRQSLFANDHPCYAGNLGFAGDPHPNSYAEKADLIIAVGTRLGSGTTLHYKLIAAPKAHQKIVHVHPGAEELGRVVYADLAIQADVNMFAYKAAAMGKCRKEGNRGSKLRNKAHLDYENSLQLSPQEGPIDMGEIMAWLRTELPRDTIVTNGAGNFADWPNRFYAYRGTNTIVAPVSGAMGHGVPGAVAAKLAYPERTVVCFAGDGDFLMNGQELATAMRYATKVIFLVINNSMYGTIRMNQEHSFPGMVSGTGLTNPDFAAYARSFGANGVQVTETEEFFPAFEQAYNSSQPTLIELLVGPNHLGPGVTLSEFNGEQEGHSDEQN